MFNKITNGNIVCLHISPSSLPPYTSGWWISTYVFPWIPNACSHTSLELHWQPVVPSANSLTCLDQLHLHTWHAWRAWLPTPPQPAGQTWAGSACLAVDACLACLSAYTTSASRPNMGR